MGGFSGSFLGGFLEKDTPKPKKQQHKRGGVNGMDTLICFARLKCHKLLQRCNLLPHKICINIYYVICIYTILCMYKESFALGSVTMV